MSLFFREKRALGDIGNPLIPTRPDARTTGGVLVTPDRALTHSAVWAAVRLRANIVSSMPLETFRPTPDGLPGKIPNPPLLEQPALDVDIVEWLWMTQISLDMRGNAYGRIMSTDRLGYPTCIDLLSPDSVVVKRDESGARKYYVNGTLVPTREMYHERNYVLPGALVGLSPIAYHAVAIGVGLAAQKFGADWFSDGAHPSGVLQTDQRVDESQAKTVKERLISSLRGNRDPLVLGNGVKWQQIQVSANESQFLETMRYSVEEVARIFDLPAEMIGGQASGSNVTYANVEQRGIDMLTYRLGPVFARRERKLSTLIPRGQFCRFNVSEVLRTDIETQAKTDAIRVASKVVAPSEVRTRIGMSPLTDEQKAELDLVPLTVTPMGGAKALPIPPSPSPEPAPTEKEPAA